MKRKIAFDFHTRKEQHNKKQQSRGQVTIPSYTVVGQAGWPNSPENSPEVKSYRVETS